MIKYIKIEGFKSIKKMELELRPINILIGGNGSGKSNFISFFKLLAAIFKNGFKQYIVKENPDNLLYFGRKRTEQINSEISLINAKSARSIYNFSLQATNNGSNLIPFDSIKLFIGNNLHPSRLSLISDKQSGAVDLNQEEALIFLQLYGPEKIQVYHFHDTSNTSYLRRASNVADNSFLRQDGRNLPAYLYYLQEKYAKAFNLIVRTIQSVAPYIDRFILQPNRLNEKEIELRWVDTGDLESNFSAYELSDGTLRFIALATLLLQPQPPEVIVIDEPELGLHPFAVGKLAGMIQVASAKAQVIAATQSPGLISQFAPEDVVVIDKSKKENQSIFKRLDSDTLNNWLQDYTLGGLVGKEYYQRCSTLYETGMKRIIIVCEGQTEQSFCNDVLQHYFSSQGTYLQNPVIKKNGGGIVNWVALKRQIENHLLEDKTAIVTTLIDYYGMYSHHGFPGWDAAEKLMDGNERLDYLETAMLNDIQEFLQQRFISYIQLHEFEALLFSDIAVIRQQFAEEDITDDNELEQIITAYPNPEMINNDRNTAPSKRLKKLIVGYRKTVAWAYIGRSH